MPSSTVDQTISILRELIDSYESGKLKKDMASLTRQFGIEVTYTLIVPIIAAVLTALFTSLAVMLAPIGVGLANIADKFLLSKTLISSYFKDKDALEARPGVLRAILKLARIEPDTHKQEEMLTDVRQKILSYQS
jgi:hypothetical protein